MGVVSGMLVCLLGGVAVRGGWLWLAMAAYRVALSLGLASLSHSSHPLVYARRYSLDRTVSQWAREAMKAGRHGVLLPVRSRGVVGVRSGSLWAWKAPHGPIGAAGPVSIERRTAVEVVGRGSHLVVFKVPVFVWRLSGLVETEMRYRLLFARPTHGSNPVTAVLASAANQTQGRHPVAFLVQRVHLVAWHCAVLLTKTRTLK